MKTEQTNIKQKTTQHKQTNNNNKTRLI